MRIPSDDELRRFDQEVREALRQRQTKVTVDLHTLIAVCAYANEQKAQASRSQIALDVVDRTFKTAVEEMARGT